MDKQPMKRLMKPLSEGDYCALEDLLNDEIEFLKSEREQIDNADYHRLVDASIKRNIRLLKTLWILSEWNR